VEALQGSLSVNETWYQLDNDVVLQKLESDKQGLSSRAAETRQQTLGKNELAERHGRGVARILWEQFREPMIWLLTVAALVSLVIGEYLDAGAVGAIVILNAILGFVQDYRAERAMEALRKLAVPEVKVRRDGEETNVSATDLVPGDVVLLAAGNRVPADCRVLASQGIKAQEAALTGESQSVPKTDDPLPDSQLPLGDRSNMLFMGTDISGGHGEAIVTAIGMDTELGKIAGMIQDAGLRRTPLQRRLAKMGLRLAIAALGIIAIVFLLGWIRGQDLSLLMMTSLSMAVAAVPEGLPAVATIALALGAKRMLQRKALIRRLPAVETLGSVTVICSDKTGTLTENRMHLSELRDASLEWPLSADQQETLDRHPTFALSLLAGTLCNDAKVVSETVSDSLEAASSSGRDSSGREDASDAGGLPIDGDPTEAAFVDAAEQFGLNKTSLEEVLPRIAEVPFDSERKRMTTIHRVDEPAFDRPLATLALNTAYRAGRGNYLALMKGAADEILEVCSSAFKADEVQALDETQRQSLETANDEMAHSGRRVLGIAIRWLDQLPDSEVDLSIEQEFTFVGLAGLIDPPRPEAAAAVRRCQAAGIRPVMITGDHPLTARNIASRLGMDHDERHLTGRDLEQIADSELHDQVADVSVFARVAPEHKLRIVKALQAGGQIVAMTGDGVNDAPALKTADIGVAMGITGTDVSKDASEAVLLDDNFATIVAAVEEGRVIYDNIRKFLKYTMTSNTGEILVMLVAPLVGMPLPLLPLQILWVNLVTDGLPGLALAVEPAERDVMQRRPRAPNDPIFSREMIRHILLFGGLMAAVSLGAGFWYWNQSPTEVYDPSWGTIVFTVLTLSQMGQALAVRSAGDSIFKIGFFTNPSMLASVTITLVLQLTLIYTPLLQRVFGTRALDVRELVACLVLSTLVFWAVELEKCCGKIFRKPEIS
jgi:Ca2+-transporting ATPase